MTDSEPPYAVRIFCTIPTYDEVQNVLPLIDALLALGPEYGVIVIDDDSPDGTWKLVAERAEFEPRVALLHRTEDPGRGRSGRDGFLLALERGAEVVIEMDADFSHPPEFIPRLVARLEGPDAPGLVLGSRHVAGGTDEERGAFRQLVTWAANGYIRIVLGLRVRDCNSGFRCWKRETLEAIDVGAAFSRGPAIVQELLYKTARKGIGIAEEPIEFRERVAGESTLDLRRLIAGYCTVLELRWLALTGKLFRTDK